MDIAVLAQSIARHRTTAPPSPTARLSQQGASEMQALLILLICLVALAILAGRYGVDSRDGLDWIPRDQASSRSRHP
jgi:hypothetical protein